MLMSVHGEAFDVPSLDARARAHANANTVRVAAYYESVRPSVSAYVVVWWRCMVCIYKMYIRSRVQMRPQARDSDDSDNARARAPAVCGDMACACVCMYVCNDGTAMARTLCSHITSPLCATD